AEDGIRDRNVTGVQTCALPISFWCILLASGLAAAHYPSSTHARLLALPLEEPLVATKATSAAEDEALWRALRAPDDPDDFHALRSEERRVGKEWRSGGARYGG